MTNKGSPKQHGGHEFSQRRSKTTLSKRANKAKARAKRQELRAKGLNC